MNKPSSDSVKIEVAQQPMRLTMITSALPPQLDGIGDYSAFVAAELAARGVEVTIASGHTPSPPGPIPGVTILPDAFDPAVPTSVRSLAAPIVATRPDWVVLQYNPFGFGPRGYNPYLAGMLRQIKRASPSTRIGIMAHETFVPFEGIKFLTMNLWQVPQYYALGQASDAMFLSIQPWAEHFSRWFPRIPTRHMPVGSNIPRVAISREEARERLGITPETMVLGLFGQAHPARMIHWIGPTVRAVHAENSNTVLLYVGPSGELVRDMVGEGARLITDGPFPTEEVSRRFAAMDIYLSPFLDGVSTRRTSFMTGLQHGIATVGTNGVHTDAMLLPEDQKAFLLAPAGDLTRFQEMVCGLARDPVRRAEIAAAGEGLYTTTFAYGRVAERFLSALEATPAK